MKAVKDKNNRIFFRLIGYKRQLVRYFLFCFNTTNFLYFYFSTVSFSLNFKFNISKLKYFCVLTSRASSVFSFFKLSRVKVKSLASFGEVIGLRKSSW